MRLYYKGLLDKKNLIRSFVILTIFLVMFFGVIALQNYYNGKINELENKIEYRTLVFENVNLAEEDVQKYRDIIEDYSLSENVIVFKKAKDVNNFVKDNQDKINYAKITVPEVENSNYVLLKIFRIAMIIFLIVILLLITLFNINYVILIEKEISLFIVLGYKYKKIIKDVFLVISAINLLATLLSYFIVLVLSNIYFSHNYLTSYIPLLIIVIFIFISYLVVLFIKRKDNNLLILKNL